MKSLENLKITKVEEKGKGRDEKNDVSNKICDV